MQWLEVDLNLQPSGYKVPSIALHHYVRTVFHEFSSILVPEECNVSKACLLANDHFVLNKLVYMR